MKINSAKTLSILVINAGSSSIKFALYQNDQEPKVLFKGKLENIGIQNTTATFSTSITEKKQNLLLHTNDYSHASNFLTGWLEKQEGFNEISAIGHRIVHGMQHTEPQLITDELIENLKKISPYDPEHLPQEIKLIELFSKHYPEIKQVACFDTSFHSTMPTVAKLLPIPRKYTEKGIRRYGFHGLSYAYLIHELERLTDKKTAHGKVILAHLGNGASLAAVKNSHSIDTTMSFTPASGVVMSSRTGDLDPGVAWYLMQFEKLSPKQFDHLVNHESGLLGVSETSSDMRELLKIELRDYRAAEAVNLFCYDVKKTIGSFAAILGGVDTLIFSGGIGENIPLVRKRICEGLDFLGIEIDLDRNEKNDTVISSNSGKVTIRVIPTNEELMIARLVSQVLDVNIKN
ncbi:acetate/propionate family kinase [Dyadobacter sp. 3J3]|uniref:acetate/propionate family kinase n=1 Tax=Dyadobacter sp. 3J3 TaxID=2606600 RepID=UPI001359F5BE|nr:acetate/propionate family kinase [Dyadobacter sp. 3J3]